MNIRQFCFNVFVCVVMVLVVLAASGYISKALADECPSFTIEQEILLRKAHAIGQHDDWGFTLAGIVWRESILGPYIVRINPSDGNRGSYGVAHMQLTTAMDILDVRNVWEAKETLVPRMISDDQFALELALTYLLRHESRGWRGMIARYNGSGEAARLYAEDVVQKTLTLQRCLSME